MSVTAFGREKIFFQNKFYSLKAHAHHFTVLITLATSRAARIGIFTLLRSQTYPEWVLDQSRDRASSYYNRPKKFLYYPLELYIIISNKISGMYFFVW